MKSRVTRSGARLTFEVDRVIKQHRSDTDAGELAARVALAARPELAEVVVPPLIGKVLSAERAGVAVDRLRPLVTVWPREHVLDAVASEEAALSGADQLPWFEIGALAAALHRVSPEPGGLGAMPIPLAGTMARLQRSLATLDRIEALGAVAPRVSSVVRRAVLSSLSPDDVRPVRRSALVHGDLHLGQLARAYAAAPWRLIDIEDLGWGDPATDLARFAGFWAAGVMPDQAWFGVLAGYRQGGGPAVPLEGDPWPRLDHPARAAVAIATVAALEAQVSSGEWDEAAEALLEACTRMAR